MRLCIDCKYFVLANELGDENLQSKHAICGLTSRVDGRDGRRCMDERKGIFFSCGKSAKNFRPKDAL